METPVGLRFCPTDEEIVVDYLWPKNSDRDTSHVDRFINTVPVCRLDPWELPCKSFISPSVVLLTVQSNHPLLSDFSVFSFWYGRPVKDQTERCGLVFLQT